jgi:hypothetical protein
MKLLYNFVDKPVSLILDTATGFEYMFVNEVTATLTIRSLNCSKPLIYGDDVAIALWGAISQDAQPVERHTDSYISH